MREKTVERRLVREAESRGWKAYKFVSPGRRNVPDRLLVLPLGRMVLVECKAPNEKPRRGQERLRHELAALGVHVYVVDSFDSVDWLIEELEVGP